MSSHPQPTAPGTHLRDIRSLLLQVSRRPSARLHAAGQGTDHQLPILVLKVASAAERGRVAQQIEQWCNGATPSPIPVVRCPAPAADLRAELTAVRGGFHARAFGKMPRFAFPRADLTEVLMDYAADGGGDDLRQSLVAELATRDRLARTMRSAPTAGQAVASTAESAGTKLGKLGAVLAAVLAALAKPVLHWRLRTRLAWLGGRYYWFRKNINANRGMDADTNFFNQVYFLCQMAQGSQPAFGGYADGQRVSAFLDDLQNCYRRGWAPWGGWARPVYPVLLLEEVPGGGARAALLQQINRNRSEGRWDPLFVIAVVADERNYQSLQTDIQPPTVGGPSPVSLAGTTAAAFFSTWSEQFPGALRPATPDGWFVFMPLGGEEYPAPGRRDNRLQTRRRPRWTRFPVQLVSVAADLAVVIGSTAGWSYVHQRAAQVRRAAYWREFCAPGVRRLNGQCMGVAPAGFEFGQHDWTASLDYGTAVRPGLAHLRGDLTVTQLETDIARQNARVTRQAGRRGTTAVTVVYMGPLTLPGQVTDPQTDGTRELAGVYAAQQAWDSTPPDGVMNQPLTRILIANAGASMQAQYQVAEEIIHRAEAGAPIVGVVGVGMNEPSTPETVGALQRAGIPIVGTTNSMDTAYPFYFQLASDDRWEAQVGTDYLRRLPGVVHGVRMVDTTSGYTRELGADVNRALSPAERRAMPELRYSSPRNLPNLAAQACSKTHGQLNLIYYLGRSEDLYWLINRGLAGSVRCGGNAVTILTGDDASKFSGRCPATSPWTTRRSPSRPPGRAARTARTCRSSTRPIWAGCSRWVSAGCPGTRCGIRCCSTAIPCWATTRSVRCRTPRRRCTRT